MKKKNQRQNNSVPTSCNSPLTALLSIRSSFPLVWSQRAKTSRSFRQSLSAHTCHLVSTLAKGHNSFSSSTRVKTRFFSLELLFVLLVRLQVQLDAEQLCDQSWVRLFRSSARSLYWKHNINKPILGHLPSSMIYTFILCLSYNLKF